MATGSRQTEAARQGALAAPALLAIMLGAFLVLGTGFAPLPIVHNAAHDARHALFPCH
jgi:cobalt transporter subunit CbtB